MKDVIEFSSLVKAPVEKVFDAMATSKGLNRWFTTRSVFEEKPEGKLEFYWEKWGVSKGNYESKGRVLEYNKPKRVVFEWDEEGLGTTKVEIDFEERDDGTVVKLKDSCPSNTDKVIGRATGWGEAVTLMKFYVEHGVKY